MNKLIQDFLYYIPKFLDTRRMFALEWSLTPRPTQLRSFQRQSSQPITWLILTNETVQENKQT